MSRHAELSRELAVALRTLGFVRGAAAKRAAEVWQATAGLGVTERREEVRHATADLTAQAYELEAEVEALRVELHAVEVGDGDT